VPEAATMQHRVLFTFTTEEDFSTFINFLRTSGFPIHAVVNEALIVECNIATHFISITLRLFKPVIVYLG
jgi:hypothetical protein